ncbi:MAG TPA: cytochrome c biogenesis protein CcdA [Actinomycetota bacterium]|nr:cytochrome c biogenesis protein CcdA [Actinomycetota bacterium]
MAFAFIGGALAILNPCGFPLLVAHLSLSAGGAPQRGVARGLAVASGFVAVMLAVSIPLSLGLHEVVRVLPRAGMVIGVALVVAGALMLSGRSLGVSARVRARPVDGSVRSFVVLGAAQAVVALGCTLPVFLAVVGAAGARGGAGGVLAAAGAYAAGAVTLLVILSAGAASAGKALTARLRGAVRHTRWIGGTLLVTTGGYLVYFWWRLSSAPASLSSDPLVATVQSFSSWLYRVAGAGDAALLSAALAAGLSAVLLSAVWRRSGRPHA